jgi:hypothetical protein
MSTIQQLKNFIRHGKQARVVDEPPRSKNDSSPSKQQPASKSTTAARNTDPEIGTSTAAKYTTAHHDPAQPQAIDIKTKQQKRIPDENIAKLVAEENASKSMFPQYPGLERWELLEKMGDGAFSNVYRARDREGDAGEVAIKVVRKFEMNSMQVCGFEGPILLSRLSVFLCLLAFSFPFSFAQAPFTDTRAYSRVTDIFIPTLSQRLQGPQRCEVPPFLCPICVRAAIHQR